MTSDLPSAIAARPAAGVLEGYDAYLFDIDGTLLNCKDAVHFFSFCEALTAVAGQPLNLDGVVTHGNTDVGILRDAFALGGVPEAEWRPRLAEIRERMCRFVEREQGDFQIEVLPGVREVLGYLRGRGAVLGVATGNLEGLGRLKLANAGLLEFFDFGGFSDQFEFRRDVFGAALEQAKGRAGAGARVCVVGDTPEDVRAAHAHGLEVVAVATGIFSLEHLRSERPTYCVPTLVKLMP